jgi:hypothetical protein
VNGADTVAELRAIVEEFFMAHSAEWPNAPASGWEPVRTN